MYPQGGCLRTVSSTSQNYIYQSNHFLSYGVDSSAEADPDNPEYNFGLPVKFESRWRLEAG